MEPIDDKELEGVQGKNRRVKPNAARWATNNMIANQPTMVFDDLPSVQTRSTSVFEWEKLERSRTRGAAYYRENPDHIGLKWVLLWRARNATAAMMALDKMASVVYKPLKGEKYRWIFARRKTDIYGMLTLSSTEEMTDAQLAIWTRHVVLAREGRGKRVNQEAGQPFTETP